MKPLAHRIRPETLEHFVGQQHLVGENKPIRIFLQRKVLPPSLIFWGPPGTGKTTLARILAAELDYEFIEVSAVSAGKDDLRKAVNRQRLTQNRVMLFIDEIHRFNKAQQDFLLPYVEDGTLNVVGATTENPSFEVNSALLSRSQVYTLKCLEPSEITQVIRRGAGEKNASITKDAMRALTQYADGDARTALNILDLASDLTEEDITVDVLQDATQQRSMKYDKDGEDHFNQISALHKSMRDSDVDASVYWTMRMLEAGEDPKYIVRRMTRFASEDVGNADPEALKLSVAAKDAVEFLGVPECNTALVQLAAYLTEAPKSNAAYRAVKKAQNVIKDTGALPVPKVIRNAPTTLMRDEGYGEGYVYAHDDAEAAKDQQHLPDEIVGEEFYDSA